MDFFMPIYLGGKEKKWIHVVTVISPTAYQQTFQSYSVKLIMDCLEMEKSRY